MQSFIGRKSLGLAMLVVFLVGCKTTVEKDPAYDLAQQCVAIQAYDNQRYVVAIGDESYGLADVTIQDAEKFFLKPSSLGEFLVYDRDGQFLKLDLIHVVRADEAAKGVEWAINAVDVLQGGEKIADVFSLVSPHANQRLLHNGETFFSRDAEIAQVSTQKSAFNLVKVSNESCKTFPEASVDATVSPEFNTAKSADARVTGWADLHAHIGFPKSMGSVVMAGEGFNPYGIEHALHDCKQIHGGGGALDLLEMQRADEAGGGHSTRGYPYFDYWPNRETVSHVTTYYKWVERAYLSGLRLMVTHVTGNPTFCQLIGAVHLDELEGDCSPFDTVELQTQYMYDMQDYIDAQAGGPGKGWMRIVKTSAEARKVINENKMALVLGTEYGTLFDCTSSNEDCTAEFVDEQLQKLYDMGVRSVFPIHRFDNAFGGAQTGGDVGAAWMHLTSKMNTGHIHHLTDLVRPDKLLFKPVGGNYFDMQPCPEGVDGTSGVYNMQKFFDKDFSIITEALRGVPSLGLYLGGMLDYILIDKMGPVPDYAYLEGENEICNVRALQPAGQHLVNRIMDKGMILEIDHMSYATTDDAMKLLEARNYSGVVSSHGWLADEPHMLKRVYGLGGMAVPMKSQPSGTSNRLQYFKDIMAPYGYEIGLGIGSDIQGVTSQTSGDRDYYPEYPFKSADGMVDFTQPQTGERVFDFHEEGIAHYGLYPEWVDNLRRASEAKQNDSFEIFMNSAEAYLQMWARAEAAAIE